MIFDVTNISKVIFCEDKNEMSQLISTNSYDDFTVYLVKHQENNFMTLYYGYRRLKDMFIVDSLPPSLPESPTGKMYLVSHDGIETIDNTYYKYLKDFREPKIATVDGYYFKEFIKSSLDGIYELVLSNETGRVLVLSSNSDGQLSQEVLDLIKSGLDDRIEEVIGSLTEGDIRWERW